jgi:histone-lysine N-methyltransferase SETMAR
MECSHEAIRQHLQHIGKVLKEEVWVPHQLSAHNRIQRVTIASSLLANKSRKPFLDRIVTGDEKCVLFVNVKKRKQWLSSGQTPVPTPKP